MRDQKLKAVRVQPLFYHYCFLCIYYLWRQNPIRPFQNGVLETLVNVENPKSNAK